MKSISSIIVFTLLCINSFSQENFKVIKVNGEILLKTRGTSLETGTVFSVNEDLLFRTEDATAAVINAKNGRLILTNKNHNLSESGSNFLPAMYNVSTRGWVKTSLFDLKDLMNYFTGKLVVLTRHTIKIDNSNFPMNRDSFFFLRYIFKGEDINKKLEYSGDTLIINRKSLLTVDGKPIPSPDNTLIHLFYRSGSDSHKISSFDLILPDLDQLKNEVGIMLDEMKSKTAKEKANEVRSYLTDFYGSTDYNSLVVWLSDTFGLKIE